MKAQEGPSKVRGLYTFGCRCSVKISFISEDRKVLCHQIACILANLPPQDGYLPYEFTNINEQCHSMSITQCIVLEDFYDLKNNEV